MPLQFRNVDADPSDAVSSWPYEALVTALERGGLTVWRRVAAEIESDPWGPVARNVEAYLSYEQPYGVAWLMGETISRARRDQARRERDQVAEQVRTAVSESRLTRAQFATAVGTSEPRLSTYCSGKVTPSAAMLLRIRAAAEARARR